MSCSKGVEILNSRTGPYKGQKVIVDGPEYENAAGLGSNCGIFDPDILSRQIFIAILTASDTITWGNITCIYNGVLSRTVY